MAIPADVKALTRQYMQDLEKLGVTVSKISMGPYEGEILAPEDSEKIAKAERYEAWADRVNDPRTRWELQQLARQIRQEISGQSV